MRDIAEQYKILHDLLGNEDPCAKLCCIIKQTIGDMIDAIPPTARVGIRAGGYHTEYLLKMFDFSQKNIIGIFDRQGGGEELYGYSCYGPEKIEGFNCDYIILSTYFLRDEIKQELKTYRGKVIDFYTALEKKGIKLQAPFHHYVEGGHMALNYYYHKYSECEKGTAFEKTLREVLQAAIENKDFVTLYKLWEENGGSDGTYPFLKEAWHRAEELLRTIARKFQARKQKDIILYWADAIPYESFLRFFPKMKQKSEDGCSFLRAYTNTPYTHPTMRAMMSGLMPIDDFEQTQKPINSSNSSLLRYLEERGYEVKIFTSATAAIAKAYLVEMDTLSSCNVKWWEAICRLLQSDKPVFYIVHFMSESHAPIIFPNFQKAFYDIFEEKENQQKKAAYDYLDQSLFMYSELAGDKMQIFFSDHGDHIRSEPKWAERNLHAFCFALGKGIERQTVSQFLAYSNFYGLVQWLLEPDVFSLEAVCSDEVIFQDVDVYNPQRVRNFIQWDIVQKALSYRGVLNNRCKYVINSLGEEFFYIQKEDGTEQLVPLEDDGLRERLLKQCGSNFLDVYKLEKFRFSRKLYEVIEKKRTAMPSDREG